MRSPRWVLKPLGFVFPIENKAKGKGWLTVRLGMTRKGKFQKRESKEAVGREAGGGDQ